MGRFRHYGQSWDGAGHTKARRRKRPATFVARSTGCATTFTGSSTERSLSRSPTAKRLTISVTTPTLPAQATRPACTASREHGPKPKPSRRQESSQDSLPARTSVRPGQHAGNVAWRPGLPDLQPCGAATVPRTGRGGTPPCEWLIIFVMLTCPSHPAGSDPTPLVEWPSVSLKLPSEARCLIEVAP